MLSIQEIQLKNFLSHENTTIKLKSTQKLLLDGKSGHGKSTIIDSLVWCLYGRGRTDNRSLIKHGEDSANVFVILKDDKNDEIFKIDRSVDNNGKNTLKISKQTSKGNFLPIKVTGLKNIQDYLENEILHSSYILFINSIVYPQDNIESFVKQTASKRKDIILEIAKVGAYDNYYEKTKSEITSQNTLLNRDETIISSLKDSIGRDTIIVEPIPLFIEEKNKLEIEIRLNTEKLQKLQANEAVISNMNNQLLVKNNELSKMKTEIYLCEEKIKNANKRLIEIDNVEIKKIEEEIKDIEELKIVLNILKKDEEKVSIWKTEMLKLIQQKPVDLNFEYTIKKINEQIMEVMGRSVLMCPELNKECPHFSKERDVQVSHYEEQLKNTTKDYEDFKNRIKEYNDKVAILDDCPESKSIDIRNREIIIQDKENKKNKIEKMKSEKALLEKSFENDIINGQSEIIKLKERIDICEKEVNELNELTVNTPSMASDILNITSIINLLQTKYNATIQSLAVAENAELRIKEDSVKLTKVINDLKTTEEKIEALKLLKDAFGQNGIKTIIIDYILPRLEDKINDILSKLSDFRVHLNTQHSSVKGDTIIEGLFITIINESGYELNYDNYSGSEKLRITYAIFEGLASLQNIGFRIIDELVQGMDPEIEAKFAEIILQLKEDVGQIICVSHLQTIKDLFEEKVEIVKIDGVSKIN
jgi:DNA repair exonuclease SbcCD ATPase subunit